MASLDKQQTKSRKMDVQNSVTSDDLARYVRLLFFGLMNVARESDTLLLRKRLWRNHHRVLDSLSRGVARSLSELAVRNGTSKQALHKSIQGLLRANLVQVEVDPLHRRAKSVKLTPQVASSKRRWMIASKGYLPKWRPKSARKRWKSGRR